jgi:hypothetical protein
MSASFFLGLAPGLVHPPRHYWLLILVGVILGWDTRIKWVRWTVGVVSCDAPGVSAPTQRTWRLEVSWEVKLGRRHSQICSRNVDDPHRW